MLLTVLEEIGIVLCPKGQHPMVFHQEFPWFLYPLNLSQTLFLKCIRYLGGMDSEIPSITSTSTTI